MGVIPSGSIMPFTSSPTTRSMVSDTHDILVAFGLVGTPRELPYCAIAGLERRGRKMVRPAFGDHDPSIGGFTTRAYATRGGSSSGRSARCKTVVIHTGLWYLA